MADIYAMIDAVRDYLDADNWNYEYDEARKIIRTGVNLDCKLQSTRLFVTFNENGFSTIATISMKADEANRERIAEYITRANYGLRNGNFEMDYNDGEIRYKLYTNCKGIDRVPSQMIGDAIIIPPTMFERYGNGLAALMFGFSTPKEEIEKAEAR